jgi:hypothetical protein
MTRSDVWWASTLLSNLTKSRSSVRVVSRHSHAISSLCCLPLESFGRYLLVCIGRVLQLGLFCLPYWGEVGVSHSFLGCETFLLNR